MSDSTRSGSEFYQVNDCPNNDAGFFNLGLGGEGHLSNAQKWYLSIVAGIIFAILISPMVLGLFDSISMSICAPPMGGNGMTLYGLIILTLIFILIMRVLMM